MTALLAMTGVQGYAMAVNGGAAAFYAADFGLDDAGMARTFGWIGLGSIGTVLLARLIDRLGRRRLFLSCVAGLSVSALATAAATGVVPFIGAQIALGIFVGTLMATVTVVIAEELPIEMRARGQSFAGVANTLGAGSALICVAIVVGLPGSWRWAWVIAAVPILALPFLHRGFPETARFEHASRRRETRDARVLELFDGRYRRRTIGVLFSVFLAQTTMTATQSWLLYHPERHLGLDPDLVTAVIILGGAGGLVGYPLGARLADRVGRRWTVLVCGSASVVANVAYYWVPADFSPSPAIALGGLFAVGSLMTSASIVGFRAASTELFPTRLRGTLQGVLMALASTAAVVTQFATAALTELLGSLAAAIPVLAVVGIPGFALFFFRVAETAGLELEEAALENVE
jgi:MFS family permease